MDLNFIKRFITDGNFCNLDLSRVKPNLKYEDVSKYLLSNATSNFQYTLVGRLVDCLVCGMVGHQFNWVVGRFESLIDQLLD